MVLIDSRKKRDGAAIEELGWYNPISDKKDCELKSERIIYWLKEGAQPTKAAKKLIKTKGIAFEWHLSKSGADEKEIQKQLKKRDLDRAATKKKKEKSTKVNNVGAEKENIKASKKNVDNSNSTDLKETVDDSKKETKNIGKSDINIGSKEEE